MDEKSKYICEKCKFESNIKSRWNAHINTELHKTGKRKKRIDIKEPFKCNNCEYQTKNKTLLIQHQLNAHADIKERQKKFRYYCKNCDYGTFSIDLYNRHIETDKHKKSIIRHKKCPISK